MSVRKSYDEIIFLTPLHGWFSMRYLMRHRQLPTEMIMAARGTIAHRVACESYEIMPVSVSVRFSEAPVAVLGTIARLHVRARRARVSSSMAAIGEASGAAPSTINKTLRDAERQGLIRVERAGPENLVIEITDPEWRRFLTNPAKNRQRDIETMRAEMYRTCA
jgi:hypothetical protein